MTWSSAIGIEIAAEFDALGTIYEYDRTSSYVYRTRIAKPREPKAPKPPKPLRVPKPAPVRPGHTRGAAHHATAFTADDVLAIRAALAAGCSGYSLAKSYGVSATAIHRIKHRLAWAHLPEVV